MSNTGAGSLNLRHHTIIVEVKGGAGNQEVQVEVKGWHMDLSLKGGDRGGFVGASNNPEAFILGRGKLCCHTQQGFNISAIHFVKRFSGSTLEQQKL